MLIQIRYTRTIVGFFNVYLVNRPELSFVTLNPDKFYEVFPTVSEKVLYGCGELPYSAAESLFGSLEVSKIA
jgi:hypothetical protein